MNTLHTARRIFAALGVAGLLAGAISAHATTWKEEHPRRAEVNNRLSNQNARINNEVKEGEISQARAAQLHRNDHQIRQEERDMASQNGGHITKSEQRTLNQQENANSRRIGS